MPPKAKTRPSKKSRETTPKEQTPHRDLRLDGRRELFAAELFDRLWKQYRKRVPYVQVYEQIIGLAGASFVNDHIAFRTIATGRGGADGIASLARIFEAAGYRAAGCYQFPEKHLGSIHYQHRNPDLPKLFISELRVWELPSDIRRLVLRTIGRSTDTLPTGFFARVWDLDQSKEESPTRLAKRTHRYIGSLPWSPPRKKDVIAVNEVSQFAAWVMVHGFQVNHFTALVNSHGVASIDSIDKTVEALREAGVPMKTEIEGDPGSRLRQTATEAVTIEVPARVGGKKGTMPWPYAYFEIAERGDVADPTTGQTVRFEGFLGPQATQLFEMTRQGEPRGATGS
ncbi:hypothetical protein Pan216_44290 [Planctomycetes bacterium Pan216]|uniref:2-oxoadipate dioxygenase/decarboxylase n=1 Tax=Kolteria novifilia TaxID=2527975 RepID=A0A518B9A3_9BACT|nr:hypothetical protein Pan216_44290 [Planctomycetes bacterium Pan216]